MEKHGKEAKKKAKKETSKEKPEEPKSEENGGFPEGVDFKRFLGCGG